MLGALLRIPNQAVVERVHRELVTAGFDDLTLASLVVFQHLSLRAGVRLTALAEAAQMTKQSMGYLVDFLQTRGYVESMPDPTDGRARLIRTTSRGDAVEETARLAILNIREEWAAAVGQDRIEALETTLGDLVRIIESRPPPAE